MFRCLLPEGTPVRFLRHDEFMTWARTQEFVQNMLRMGVYFEDTIDDEFIHPAATLRGEVLVDTEQIVRLMEGVPSTLAFGYAAAVALHEGHHLEAHEAGARHAVGDTLQQELECADYLDQQYPSIAALAEAAEAHSLTIRRITKRLKEGFDKALGG